MKEENGHITTAENYPYIWAWGQYNDSAEDYIKTLMLEAEKDGAPVDAIYKDVTGTYRTVEDIDNTVTRFMLDSYAKEFLNSIGK